MGLHHPQLISKNHVDFHRLSCRINILYSFHVFDLRCRNNIVHFASLAENSLGTENAINIKATVLKMGLKLCYLGQSDTTECEVLTAVYILMMVFLCVTRCSPRFRRNMLLTFSLQETTIMKMETAGSFDTFVPICQIM
jgi:hypothetical protein